MIRWLSLISTAFLFSAMPARALAAPVHGHLHHSLHEIREAIKELEGADHNFGGHKEAAIRDLKAAAVQIEKALAAVGDPFPADFKAKPDVYKNYKNHQHLRHAEVEIAHAIKEVKESKAEFGEHRARAVHDLEAALVQVKKCIEHIK